MFEKELLQINGSKTLIVGATGDIGTQIAMTLKNLDQEIHGVGRNKKKLNDLEKLGIETSEIDIGDENAIVDFAKSCENFDNVILCSGVNGPRPSRMCNDAFIRGVINTNLLGIMNFTSNLIRRNKICSPGRIVFISSIACHIAATNNAAYAASKGGAESFFRGVARELLRKNITVNSIAPAAIETSLFEGNKPEILNADLYPLGVGQTEDVANATAFLLQNGAQYITGETLILDGGATWLE